MNDIFWSNRQERKNKQKFMDQVREIADRGDENDR